MGRYKDGGNSTGTVEDVTGSVANGFEVVVSNDPRVDPELSVKLNPALSNNDVLEADGSGGVKAGAVTGTGNVVRDTAPTIASAVLNTALSGTAVQDDATFASPSSTKVPTSASVKTYVDNLLAGLSWKAAVRVATTANGTLATAFANGQTVDGVTLATGDRILIKNQSTQTQNGIYIVQVSGAPVRSTDADTGAELLNATCLVEEGTVNAETQWTCSTNAPITIGVSNIVFVAVNVGTYSAGNGLSLTGNQFAIDTSIVVDKTTAQTLTNKTLTAPIISTISNTGTLTLPTSTDTLTGRATTDTLTNKTLSSTTNTIKRVTTDASTATPTPTGDSDFNHYYLSALATNATFAAPSGTPKEGNSLVIRITPDATPRTLAFNAIYRAVGITLPTTTVASKTIYLGATYNSTDSKWDVNAYAIEA